jgi:TRAP-type mannitol/chloroaromatic compound transport system substrate-binding protein
MAAAEKISFELMEEKAAKNPSYAKVYNHWKTFRASANRWFGTAELAYQDYVLRPFAPK